LKLPLLLTQFLYKNKKLRLPGIGIFTLDPAAVIPDEHNKDLHATAMGIEFKNAPVREADDELVEYIRVNTGKIKPLAISDIESYLALATQLLNIGKPFYLEGIGTLTKDKEGRFIFTRGEYAVVRQEDGSLEKAGKPQGKRKSVLEETHFEPQPNNARRFLLVFALIGGLSLVGWGGYMLYKKNTAPKNETGNTIAREDSTAVKPDSAAIVAAAPDSLSLNKQESAKTAPGGDSVLYKFNVLETSNKLRALKRYNQLLSFDLKIRLYTQDSSFFKVYFRFPALPKDTIHIKDSLQREYGHRITIEK
jgi:hypothetical protein